jgi:tetratricopeptide (TPR) repeat protein
MGDDVSRCYYCGVFVRAGDRFCWSCGREQALAGGVNGKAHWAAERDLTREDWLSVRRAYLLRTRGQLEEAERLLREVLTRQPQHVPTLTLLAEIQRQRGDVVSAVESAQAATDAAAAAPAPPGSLRRAREERAEIEESVIQELVGAESLEAANPLNLFVSRGRLWYRSGRCYSGLAAAGLVALFLAVMSALRGHPVGYVWLFGSLLAAGWVYQDAESRRRRALFWGPLVLCTGPFGLAVYVLSR